MVGFAQIETEDQGANRIIPETRDMVPHVGHVDSLCGFVDSGIAKGFFWDLFDEHDGRYYQQIISYTRGAYGWTPTVVGRNVRSYTRGVKEPSKKEPVELVREISRSYKEPTAEVESLILTDAQAALQYITNAMNSKRWSKAEPVIATNRATALFYLQNILRGTRFPEAEALLGENNSTAITYVRVTKLRWKDLGFPEVEKRLTQGPWVAFEYVKALGKSFPEAEFEMEKDPKTWELFLQSGIKS